MARTPIDPRVESFLVLNCLVLPSCTGPVLVGPFSSQLVPDTPSIVPAPLVFPPCVVVRVIHHAKCLRGLPPFHASSLEHMPQGINHHFRPFITDPSHSSPHTLGDHFRQLIHGLKLVPELRSPSGHWNKRLLAMGATTPWVSHAPRQDHCDHEPRTNRAGMIGVSS